MGEYVCRMQELACRSQGERFLWRHHLQPDEQPRV